MHTWYTQNTPTGRLHVLRTPKYSAVRFQPTNQTRDSQSLTPRKTKFPKPSQTPKCFLTFPERIFKSPQVNSLLPKVMYQLNIELSYHNEHCPTIPIGIPPDKWYHKYNSQRTINYHSWHTYVRAYPYVWVIADVAHARTNDPQDRSQTEIHAYVSSSSLA